MYEKLRKATSSYINSGVSSPRAMAPPVGVWDSFLGDRRCSAPPNSSLKAIYSPQEQYGSCLCSLQEDKRGINPRPGVANLCHTCISGRTEPSVGT